MLRWIVMNVNIIIITWCCTSYFCLLLYSMQELCKPLYMYTTIPLWLGLPQGVNVSYREDYFTLNTVVDHCYFQWKLWLINGQPQWAAQTNIWDMSQKMVIIEEMPLSNNPPSHTHTCTHPHTDTLAQHSQLHTSSVNFQHCNESLRIGCYTSAFSNKVYKQLFTTIL